MAPVIEELAADVADYATIGKLDVDTYPHLAVQWYRCPCSHLSLAGQGFDVEVRVFPGQGVERQLLCAVVRYLGVGTVSYYP